ncbi:MAG: ABC transporter ATP-binding protein/permease [Culturomica sp.]|jgi:ATP-binding cassette subfamily B protein|nr:ABC transporter ATP-binding protein/permease [Culturomica sp.]
MRQYWQILKKYRWSLLASPLLIAIAVFCETMMPMYMSRIVDDGVMPRDLSVITATGLQMLLFAVIQLATSVANAYISARTSTRFGTDLRARLFDRIESFAFPDIDKFSSESLLTRLTGDVTRMQQTVFMSMRIMLRAPMLFLMALVFILMIDSKLALVLAAAIPLMVIIVWVILRKGLPYFLKVQRRIDRLNGVVRENLLNIRLVKSFVREDFESQKFKRTSRDLQETSIRAANIVVSLAPLMGFILNVSVVAVLWFGGGRVMEGTLSVGQLISFLNYLMQTLMAVMMFSMVVMNFARASASSERILEVLTTDPSLVDTPQALANDYSVTRGEVEFRGVDFRYGGGENDVLSEISFKVRQGETIAVVGATGSGKTSLIGLIPRLYDVTAGEVMIDGRDVRDYRLGELRLSIGVVLQKNELFSGTILENLRWGNPKATLEEVEDAARTAQAHDFVMSFEKGYDTVLGRGGVNVSGGQKQRLCIARALLRKPRILILDDSTSAVDSTTELKIRLGLRRVLAGTTVFIITQRIHTMQSADRVLVLEDGRIDGFDVPAELLKTSKVYKEIYDSQQFKG